jgi:undecaprenyl-diphosphatase
VIVDHRSHRSRAGAGPDGVHPHLVHRPPEARARAPRLGRSRRRGLGGDPVRDILRLIAGFFRGLATRKPFADPDSREAWYVIFATIPIVVLGVLLKDLIEGVFRSTWVVTFQLVFIAVLMQVAEAYAKRRGFRTKEDFNAKDAWIIGAGQCIALIPGSSRSGSTIMTALFRRVPHDYAARFSFVMSIPAITAAGVYELISEREHLATIGTGPMIVAIIVAFISGWASIYFLLRYLRTHTTHVFIYYRYVLGVVLAALLIAGYVK